MKKCHIPLFPLSLFLLPQESADLYIFEERYRQLLHDTETEGIEFGIYFSHTSNKHSLGSVVKLDKVLCRYDTGESDIRIQCTDLFQLNRLYLKGHNKPYPTGDITIWDVADITVTDSTLISHYKDYMKLKQQEMDADSSGYLSTFQLVNRLNLTLSEKLKFAKLFSENRFDSFLNNHMRYQKFLIKQEIDCRDNYHLN